MLNNPMHLLMVIAPIVAFLTVFLLPPVTASGYLRRMGLVFLVLYQLRSEVDKSAYLEGLPKDISGTISIVTGANGGIGYSVAKSLAYLGGTVIMACRNETKCLAAAQSIKNSNSSVQIEIVTTLDKFCESWESSSCFGPPSLSSGAVLYPMNLDIEDLSSIRSFSSKVHSHFPRLDLLINNAGAVLQPGHLTRQGFEGSFGGMYLGHFALTLYLQDLLLRPLPASFSSLYSSSIPRTSRVVTVSSFGYHFGFIPPSLIRPFLSKPELDLDNSPYSIASTFYSTNSDSLSPSISSSSSKIGGTDLRGELTDNCGETPAPSIFGSIFGLKVPCCPLFSCPHTNGYARAKLAQLLHSLEIQRRVEKNAWESRLRIEANQGGINATGSTDLNEDGHSDFHLLMPRRLVSLALHPGSVATDIHPFLSPSGLVSWFLRSADDAALLVLQAAFGDQILPGSYIDSMGYSHDLMNFRERFLSRHLETYSFPNGDFYYSDLVSPRRAKGSLSDVVSLDEKLWGGRELVRPPLTSLSSDHSAPTSTSQSSSSLDAEFKVPTTTTPGQSTSLNVLKSQVSRALWEASEALLATWEQSQAQDE